MKGGINGLVACATCTAWLESAGHRCVAVHGSRARILSPICLKSTRARTIPNDIKHGETSISIDGREIRVFSIPDPAAIPWDELGVDIVVESSGRFTDKAKAAKHLRGSVETVIISAPSKDADATFCMGVNENEFDAARTDHSTPRARRTAWRRSQVLHERFGIVSGIMTTIHSYTNDQVISTSRTRTSAARGPRRSR